MKKRVLSLLLAVCLLLSLMPSAFAEEAAVDVTVPGILQHTKASDLLDELNQARADEGLEPLVGCYNLSLMAQQRAAEIALYCDHTRPDGSDFHTVWTDNGSDCVLLAENIAMGLGTPQSVMTFWMDSEEASANILNEEYTEVGLACLKVGEIFCWVQVFGTGSDQGSSYSKTGTNDVDTTVSTLTSNLVPVKQELYMEMPNGYSVRVDIAYQNQAAGEGWQLNLVPECNEIVAEDGTVIARSNVVPGGTGRVNFKTRRTGIGTAVFPVYEGQSDPVSLTVNCGDFEKPEETVREAPTSSESPYAHVHTPELRNVVEGSCDSEGYTGDLVCTECEEILDEGGHYKTEHTWGPWVITGYPAWPANIGGKEHTCIICGTTENTSLTYPEEPHPDGYEITVSATMDCTIYQSITKAVAGHEVFLDVIHSEDLYIKNVRWTTEAESGALDPAIWMIHMNESVVGFTMPDGAVDIVLELEQKPTYQAILDVGEGGTAEVIAEKCYEHTPVILTVTPDEGYMIDSIQVVSYGTYVPEVIYQGGYVWEMTFPDGDLEFQIRFRPLVNPFVDVPEGTYYHDPVVWAYNNGITTGIDETHFVPAETCTRAQMVTFLWRVFGEPEPVSTDHSFTDVDESAYYYKAMLWAVENGITKGVSETAFKPNGLCIRSQAVTFLWRACGSWDIRSADHGFTDVDEDAFYYTAMLWAVEYGITNGTDATHFSPNANCSRGQVVTFLYRTFGE